MIDISGRSFNDLFYYKATKFSVQKKFGVDPTISYITEIHFLFQRCAIGQEEKIENPLHNMFISCLQQYSTHTYNLKIFIGNFIAPNFRNYNTRTICFFSESVTVLIGARQTKPQNVEYPAQPYSTGSHQAYPGYPQYDYYFQCILFVLLAVRYRVVTKGLFCLV